MQRNKILKCILTVVVLLSIFSGAGLTALAAGEVTVQVKDVSAGAGQTVTAELIMDGSFAAFQGVLIYDTDALTLENIEATSLLSGSMTMFNKDEVTGEFLNGTFVSASAKNVAVNGAVFKFTFKAGSNANGTYSFSLEQFKVFDEKGEQLTVNPVDMTIMATDPGNPGSNDPGTSPNSNNPGTSPNPNNPGTSPDSNNPGTSPDSDDPGTSPDSNDPGTSPDSDDPGTSPDSDDPDASSDPDDPDASSDFDDPGTSPDPDDPEASSDPDDNGLTVLLLVISAVVVAGIVLTVIVLRKKKKAKDVK